MGWGRKRPEDNGSSFDCNKANCLKRKKEGGLLHPPFSYTLLGIDFTKFLELEADVTTCGQTVGAGALDDAVARCVVEIVASELVTEVHTCY